MSSFLPYSLSKAASLQLRGYRFVSVHTPAADATGVIVATFDKVEDPLIWLLDWLVVTCDSTTPTDCRVYRGELRPDNLVANTPEGNEDEADNASPIYLFTGDQLGVQWSGASLGAVGRATAQYRELAPA